MERRPTKRKRTSASNVATSSTPRSSSRSSSPELDATAIFRAHFESRFEPISVTPVAINDGARSSGSDQDSGSEWAGCSPAGSSSDEEATSVEIIEHVVSEHETRQQLLTKRSMKDLLSPSKPSTAGAATDANEALNVANDLALQRLIRESHLLDDTLDLTGRNRHKAVASRIESLGAKPMAEQKMSMALRKGIEAKAAVREKKRRIEAKESGIVLEKEVKMTKKAVVEKRDRGFKTAVGKWKGGALVLSKKDVADIEGQPKRGKGMTGKWKGRR